MPKSTAFIDGWLAHKQWVEGHRANSGNINPYSQITQIKTYTEWQAGWAQRFGAVKHGLPLEHDNEPWSSDAG